ncbi:LamG-like jellyroll fold domain-containing protein [Solwaraspora sp. WMMB335]|uniref:LamG-like jellyroll fold domain-containing protein n=1 Tax=Solwaraspora sp. WMMB335 TaxID=3404118 RepID=UPI003B95EE01
MATAHLILSIGNSHTIGRDKSVDRDRFHPKVYQWTKDGALDRPSRAMLDHVDGESDEFSPDLTFADAYLAANPSIDMLVFVPHAEGGTGFKDKRENWSLGGRLLTGAVDRYNAAHAALVATGTSVVPAGALFHNANPDYDRSDPDTHREDIGNLIRHLRENLAGYTPRTPVVIGGGMNAAEFATLESANFALFQANLNGADKRHPYVGTFDTINPRHGFAKGLPVPQCDPIHASRLGDQTIGLLRYFALARAAVNADPRSPFGELSFAADLTAFWDFRSGTPLDFSGNDNHLTRFGDQPPLYRLDAQLDALAWVRPAPSQTRIHQVPMRLPASYTVAAYLKLDTLDEPMAFLQQADGPVAHQHRLQYSRSNKDIRAGHGGSADAVTFPASLIDTTSYFLLTLSYDASSGIMKLGLNGTVESKNENVSPHGSRVGSFLGAADADGSNPLIGAMAYAMVVDRALTNPELKELWRATALLGLPVHPRS